MNKSTASELADEWLHRLRSQPYAELARQVDQPAFTTTVARGGTEFQVEVTHHWDGEPGGDVRVVVAVDDGGLRALMPRTADFIKAPDGHSVGE
jgi:hypothetical protein